MSFASVTSSSVLSLRNALGVPSAKIPISGITFAVYVLPPLFCGFVAALLAVTPNTRTVRIALWPLTVSLALRALLSLDASLGGRDKPQAIGLMFLMLFSAVRAFDWALAKGVRHLRPANSTPSTIMDALDLLSNVRGHGWVWSRGIYIPRETRPSNRNTFVLVSFLSVIAYAMLCGTIHRASLTLIGIESTPGKPTILDGSLPFLPRYLRASVVTILSALAIYTAMQTQYNLISVLGILILGQDPVQWPPIFDAPWCATSLSDFWGRRWHQLPRRMFLILGGYPLSFVLGRSGIVIGAFIVSALLHHALMVTINSEMEIWWMLVGFGMMALGILAERAFRQLTGRRVGGAPGWIWTMSWLVLWGNVIVEGHARAGMFTGMRSLDSMFPIQISVNRWVADVDAWLHGV